MISNKIQVSFDPKTVRLLFAAPFHLNECIRSFPSRRFDPKTKLWRVPLVRSNINHLKEIQTKFEIWMNADAEAAVNDFEKLTSGPVYTPFPPGWFDDAKLRPYEHQQNMLDKGWGLNSYAVIGEMGVGKTFVTANMAMARFKYGQIDQVAIVCPSALFGVWRREFAKWTKNQGRGLEHLYVLREHVSGVNHRDWVNDRDGRLKVLLISVEGLGVSEKLYQSSLTFFQENTRSLVVCDESSRIKNDKALRTGRAITIGSQGDYRMFLNGTPIAIGLKDLWAQYEFLDPNIIGSGDYWTFKTRYIATGGFDNKQVVGYNNVQELMDLITPWTIEVRKSVLKLPEKVYKQIPVRATKLQRALFKKILAGGVVEGDDNKIKVENVLERMLRMQQVIGGFLPDSDLEAGTTEVTPLDENPKLDALLSMIEDNHHGHKFIIWARYIPELELITSSLRKKYGECSVVTYYGATSAADRQIAEDRYNGDTATRFFVANTAAAGLGLTLISGESDVMAYYSGTFAYIDRAQSEDRSHRIGQTGTVVIADFVMERTLDEAIVAAIAEKKNLDTFVKDAIAAGKSWINLAMGVDSDDEA